MLKQKPDTIKFINHQDKEGRTALHFAAVKNNLEVVEFLIASGASLFIVDNKGNIPLDLCNDMKLQKIIFSEMNNEVMKIQQSGFNKIS